MYTVFSIKPFKKRSYFKKLYLHYEHKINNKYSNPPRNVIQFGQLQLYSSLLLYSLRWFHFHCSGTI